MRVKYSKVTIIKFNREPELSNVDQELQWIGTSLGLFNPRDKDRSCYRVFITLLRAMKTSESLSSDELAFRLDLTRGTVVHHLNTLLSAGIIIESGNRYHLREESLKKVIEEMKKDMDSTYDNLISVADEVDKKLGL
ncbi:ArsR family transcriptional regulator [Candidatus Woesearchaeota archaeon]|nr:ArsR family transcriptional regulator [Candidatus Woesearchaeota archaeon]